LQRQERDHACLGPQKHEVRHHRVAHVALGKGKPHRPDRRCERPLLAFFVQFAFLDGRGHAVVEDPGVHPPEVLPPGEDYLEDDYGDRDERDEQKRLPPGRGRQHHPDEQRPNKLAYGEARVVRPDGETTVFFLPPLADHRHVHRLHPASPDAHDDAQYLQLSHCLGECCCDS
jgi:hypothetical protein